MRKFGLLGVAVAALSLAATSASAVELVTNGDFATGDFTGWTLFTTTNGTLGPSPDAQVTSFDTTGAGASLAAEFQVGQVAFASGVHRGGGISQSITTTAGMLTFSADFASLGGTGGSNSSGGLYSVSLDGLTLTSFDTGSIGAFAAIERGALSFSTTVTAGSHILAILMTRPFTTGGVFGQTPHQYLDNISARQAGTPGVPEPATWGLMIAGFGLAGSALRRRARAAA